MTSLQMDIVYTAWLQLERDSASDNKSNESVQDDLSRRDGYGGSGLVHVGHGVTIGSGSEDGEHALIKVNDRTGVQELDKLAHRSRPPLFIAINDDGWTLCTVGRRLQRFYLEKFPHPSEFEV